MDHFGHVDEALKAVADARKVIRRGSSRQVTSGEERDHMRTVTTVWFQTLRPRIASFADNTVLPAVDDAFRRVLDATAKAAARTTYHTALTDARKALLALRKALPATAVDTNIPISDDSAPDFAPLASEPRMQEILKGRWGECVTCLNAGANLAAVVMMGGLLESLFVSKANHLRDKKTLTNAKRAPKESKTGKAAPFQKWMLNDYIEVGHESGWIGDTAKKVGSILRDYRNFIHPQAEYRQDQTITQQDALLLWNVTKALARELLRGRS